MNPYTNLTEGKEIIREFSADVDPMELIWHEDQEDRIIEVLTGNGWQFQFDEDIPFEMVTGDKIDIPKGFLHRVIKGRGNLRVQIQKL
jgi:oxalate decarboxylase/phosphoglucose isomerase-like protein (cupin superfamily)